MLLTAKNVSCKINNQKVKMKINCGKSISYVNKKWVGFNNWVFQREKKKHITISKMTSILVQYSLEWGCIFFTNDTFKGIFVDFYFIMFTQVLIKELARILIHARKIFNFKVSLKMLLSISLNVITEKKL